MAILDEVGNLDRALFDLADVVQAFLEPRRGIGAQRAPGHSLDGVFDPVLLDVTANRPAAREFGASGGAKRLQRGQAFDPDEGDEDDLLAEFADEIVFAVMQPPAPCHQGDDDVRLMPAFKEGLVVVVAPIGEVREEQGIRVALAAQEVAELVDDAVADAGDLQRPRLELAKRLVLAKLPNLRCDLFEHPYLRQVFEMGG